MSLIWTDTLVPDITRIKKIHIQEIRDMLSAHTPVTGGHPNATQSIPGFMSAADKTILDTLEMNVSSFTSGVSILTANVPLTASASTGAVTIGIPASSPTVSGYMLATDKAKLDGIQAGAQVNAAQYVLPATLPATMIVEDTTHSFVTNTEKSNWNAKAANTVVNTVDNGLMTPAMLTLLNGVDSFPAGSIIMFSNVAGSANPIGHWFNYPGAGNALPFAGNPFAKWEIFQEMIDRFPLGQSSGKSEGETGGAKTVPLELKNIPSHKHDIYSSAWQTHGGSGGMGYNATEAYWGRTDYTGGDTTLPNNPTAPHENMPPYKCIHFLRKILD